MELHSRKLVTDEALTHAITSMSSGSDRARLLIQLHDLGLGLVSDKDVIDEVQSVSGEWSSTRASLFMQLYYKQLVSNADVIAEIAAMPNGFDKDSMWMALHCNQGISDNELLSYLGLKNTIE